MQRKSMAAGMTGGASMFDRPGMGGSIAFRNSISATLFSFNKDTTESSIGSAGSLGMVSNKMSILTIFDHNSNGHFQ